MLFSGVKKTAVGAVVGLAAAGALALSASAVSAAGIHPQGTVGQHLVLEYPKIHQGYVFVSGLNQKGNKIENQKFELNPNYNRTKLTTTREGGDWWWVGPMTIAWYFDNQYAGTTNDCNVTLDQGNVDEYTCAYHK